MNKTVRKVHGKIIALLLICILKCLQGKNVCACHNLTLLCTWYN